MIEFTEVVEETRDSIIENIGTLLKMKGRDSLVSKKKAGKFYLAQNIFEQDFGFNEEELADIFEKEDDREDDVRLKVAQNLVNRDKEEVTRMVNEAQQLPFVPDKEELELLYQLYEETLSKKPEDKKDVSVEEFVANAFANKAAEKLDNDIPDVTKDTAEAVIDGSNILQDIITKQEIAFDYLSKAKKVYEEQSTIGAVVDFAKFLLPLYDIFKNLQAANIVGVEGSLWKKGNTLEEVYTKLWALDPKEFKEEVGKVFERLKEDNPQLAIMWLNGLIEYSKNDKFWDNVFSVSDLLSVGADAALIGAKLGIKTAEATKFSINLKKVKDSIKAVAKANADNLKLDIDEILSKAGFKKEAVKAKALSIEEPLKPHYKQLEEVFEPTSLFNPEKFLKGVEDLGLHQKKAQTLRNLIKTKAEELTEAILPGGIIRVSRIPELSERLKILADEALERFYLTNNKAPDGILEKTIIHSDETPDNANKVELLLGNWHRQEPFETEHQARTWAYNNYKLKKGSFDIIERDGKYLIRTYVDIDETKTLRPELLETDSKVKPKNVVTASLSRILSADNILGKETMAQRKAAIYSMQKVIELADDLIFAYMRMGKKKRQEFNRFLDSSLRAVDLKTGEQGIYYENIQDFWTAWEKMFGKPPNEDQIEAYFQFKLLLDFDYVVRNLVVRRDLARRGVESFELKIEKDVVKFNGKLVDDIPWGNPEEAFIALFDTSGNNKIFRKNFLTEEQRKLLDEALESGEYSIIQLASAADLPFQKYFKRLPVHFAVVPTRKIKRGPLPFKLVNYNPGVGHLVYRDNFFTKIPLVRYNAKKDIYEYLGDYTIATHLTKEDAEAFAKNVEELLKILKGTSDRAAAQAFIRERGLPFSLEEFENILEGIGVRHAVSKAVAVADGDDTYSLIKNNILRDKEVINLFDTSYNLVKFAGVNHTGKRDFLIPRVNKVGSEAKPAFDMEAPKLLDPMASIAKAVYDDASMLILKDYKTKAIEDFMLQFGDLIENFDHKANNIYEAFMNPKWKENASDINRLATAKKAYLTVKNLWDTPTHTLVFRKFAKQTVLSAIDKRFGREAAEIFDDYAVPFISDPITRLRSLAFHTNIGMFNVAQLFQQAVGFVNTIAHVSPKHAIPSFIDGVLMFYQHYSKIPYKFINKKRKGIFKSSKISDDFDFKEMYETFERSGFARVGNEYADLDTLHSPFLATSKVDFFFEAGKGFFKAGERFTRAIAWSAAYREWRSINKGVKLTDQAIREIQNRADDLVGRMSTASRNKIQERGIWSIPTQFWTYTMHITELFWEAGIKDPKKFALIPLVYFLFFGLDDAVTVVTTIPVLDSLREWLAEYDAKHGTNHAELMYNPYSEFLAEGAIGAFAEAITGKEYNFAEKLGINGLKFWNPVFNIIKYGEIDNDTAKEVVNVLIGASGTTIRNILDSSGVILRNIIYAARGDFDALGLTPEDWIAIGGTFQQADNFIKGALMRAYGRYLTKKGFAEFPNDRLDRYLVAMGFEPQEISNIYFKLEQFNKNRREKKYWKNKLRESVRYFVQAVKDNDKRAIELYRKRMAIILEAAELTPLEKSQMVWDIIKEHRDVIREVEDKWIRLQIRRQLREEASE